MNSWKGLQTYSEESHKTYYYHADHLGSAQLITDYHGDEYQRIEYTPYGEEWIDKFQDENYIDMPYKFTGKERDEAWTITSVLSMDLYYYGARYLDPQTSVWLSTDPALGEYIPQAGKDNSQLPGMGGIFNLTNANLYHYAGNNPVRYTDPDGRVEIELNILQQDVTNKGLLNIDSNLSKIIKNLNDFESIKENILKQYASIAFQFLGLDISNLSDRDFLVKSLSQLKDDINNHHILDFKTTDSNDGHGGYVHGKVNIYMNGILVDSFREDNFIFIEPISFALNSAVIDEIIFHEQAHLSFDAEDYAYGFESSELCRADKLKNADSWKLFYKYTKRF